MSLSFRFDATLFKLRKKYIRQLKVAISSSTELIKMKTSAMENNKDEQCCATDIDTLSTCCNHFRLHDSIPFFHFD